VNIRPKENERHEYAARLVWTGARNGPTSSYQSCHALSYLAECARAGVHVVAYEDDAHGVMTMRDGRLRFTEVVLRPRVTVAPGTDLERATALHGPAHDDCYIANSVNFPVRHEPTLKVASS
jgi:organic hydroperoxide reductase OsmC/OhrA